MIDGQHNHNYLALHFQKHCSNKANKSVTVEDVGRYDRQHYKSGIKQDQDTEVGSWVLFGKDK